MPMEYLFLIILLVFMIGMMFFQTRKAWGCASCWSTL